MKKRIYSFLMLALVLIFGSMAVFAANGPSVVDTQGVYTSDEREQIGTKLSELSEKYNMFFVLYTVADVHDQSTAESYARDLYDENGYGEDGVILVISKNGGQGENYVAFLTKGKAEEEFSNYESILDDIAPCITEGKLVKAADYYIKAIKSTLGFDSSKFIKRSIIIVVVALILAIIICGSMASGLKSVHKKTEAGTYVVPGSMQLYNRWDNFVTSKTTKVKIETNSGSSGSRSSSGGGFGGGGRSC